MQPHLLAHLGVEFIPAKERSQFAGEVHGMLGIVLIILLIIVLPLFSFRTREGE
jgi:hypothetical protein